MPHKKTVRVLVHNGADKPPWLGWSMVRIKIEWHYKKYPYREWLHLIHSSAWEWDNENIHNEKGSHSRTDKPYYYTDLKVNSFSKVDVEAALKLYADQELLINSNIKVKWPKGRKHIYYWKPIHYFNCTDR